MKKLFDKAVNFVIDTIDKVESIIIVIAVCIAAAVYYIVG